MTDWQDNAACKGLTSLFFSTGAGDVERAKAICRICPVQVRCRLQAKADREHDGIWGGEVLNGPTRGPRRAGVCAICTEPLTGHSNAAYCSDECRATAKREQWAKAQRRARDNRKRGYETSSRSVGSDICSTTVGRNEVLPAPQERPGSWPTSDKTGVSA